MKRMKRFVFCVLCFVFCVEVWVLVWDENDDVSSCIGQRCSFVVVGDGEKLDRFFFFFVFFWLQKI